MNTFYRLVIPALAAVTLTSTLARADDAAKPIADLERFVGAWKSTGTLTMGKDTAKITATLTCKRTSAKAGVLCTTRFIGVPGIPAYEETDLFGYEPSSGTYHWFAVTSAGETHDHVAKASDASKLQFVYTGTQEAKPFKEVIDLEWSKDGKAMTVRSESFVGGASAAVLEIKARK
jgi:hypothetical protein